MSEKPKKASRSLVIFSVSFYITTALVMVLVNKWVLNSAALPFTLLFSQLIMAIILLHISSLFGIVKLPKLQKDICVGVFPLIGINVLGLSFNTVCLQYVDASFYQVARALVLPFTVLFTLVFLKKRSSFLILLSCFIVCTGFFVGVSSEKLTISFLGVFYGVFSSITTALHAIVIKKSLAVVKENTMDLVYYNNLLSSVCFIPLILLTGEEYQLAQMFSDISDPDLKQSSSPLPTFLIGIVVTGFFGFLINIAGFLQIKVTSPISHMISSAFRGVIQTVLGVAIFHDILTIGRVGSIGIILVGSCLYTWTKNYESSQNQQNKTNENDLESGQKLLKDQEIDEVIEDEDDIDDENVIVKTNHTNNIVEMIKLEKASVLDKIKHLRTEVQTLASYSLKKFHQKALYATHHNLSKVNDIYEGIRNHDRYYLAKAITLDHKSQSQQLLSMIIDSQKNTKNSTGEIKTFRIGITGPPGVGKSTFIEKFGTFLVAKGHRIAVLAVDPSSSRTGGSILGDKTRMPELSYNNDAYVRPSPSRGTLGGVSSSNGFELLKLSKYTSAGYDICIIETVGVGQSETIVSEMVDMFVLMVPPAGGDEIQGLKKGIVEVSDLVIVNKADGILAQSAREAVVEYTSALKYLRPSTPVWRPKVTSVSSKTNDGIENTWNVMQEYYNSMKDYSELAKKRGEQRKLWMWRQITSEILESLVDELEHKVFKGEMTSGKAADIVVNQFTHRIVQDNDTNFTTTSI
ncbi:11781_t:CDS:10 [Entrophospora sp. SA101]|nr:11781_t:CDS:10 [Entrophospora sp. SA101]